MSTSPNSPVFREAGVAKTAANERNEKGYECGNTFFSDSEVNLVVNFGLTFRIGQFYNPRRYLGPLYLDSELVEYLLWPIRKQVLIQPDTKYPRTSFYVVFTTNSNVAVDVISQITNNDYTKCIRKDSTQAVSSISISEGTNGYQCGHEFFSDEIVQKSVGFARKKIGENAPYPTPYVGDLYPPNSGNIIWPIFYGKRLLKTGYARGGPYFLVLSREEELIDVVVKAYGKNFLRCIRSRNVSKAPVSDQYSKLFVPAPRTGFLCGRSFFDDKKLESDAAKAKLVSSRRHFERFPESYNGHPFNEQVWLWPILANGKPYNKGVPSPYRVVLTLEFKVICVAIVSGDTVMACERKTISGKKDHDKSDYFCYSTVLYHHHLAEAADEGCERLSSAKYNIYPAEYVGPGFQKEGPYFTYPVITNAKFKTTAGSYRVVINSNCEIVGALAIIKYDVSTKRFLKCHRLDDGPPPELNGFNTLEPIDERQIEY